MVKIEDFKQKMLIGCRNIAIVEDGQCNIDLDAFNNHYNEVEAISDHDPLFAN